MLVQRFHALTQNEEAQIVPWKLQLNVRHDAPWDLLQELTYSAIWVLLGTNLKGHNQQMSGLAVHLQNLLRPSQDKGKGKGKGKKNQPDSLPGTS